MAMIQFTDADVMMTTTVENGIYPTEVAEIETGASKSGKSTNHFVTFRIVEGKYAGKELKVLFNSESNGISQLGDLQCYPSAYLLQVAAAANKTPVGAVNKLLDTDDLKHKPFDAQWGVITVDGALKNVILGFYPSGYAKGAPAFQSMDQEEQNRIKEKLANPNTSWQEVWAILDYLEQDVTSSKDKTNLESQKDQPVKQQEGAPRTKGLNQAGAFE